MNVQSSKANAVAHLGSNRRGKMKNDGWDGSGLDFFSGGGTSAHERADEDVQYT